MPRPIEQTVSVSPLDLFGRTIRLIWHIGPGYSLALLLLALIDGLLPVARLWVAGIIVDRLIRILNTPGSDWHRLIPFVLLEFSFTVIGMIAQSAGQAVQTILSRLLATDISRAVMGVAIRLDYALLEDPEFHNQLQRAQRDASYRPVNLLMGITSGLTGLIGFLGALLTLARMHPIAPVAIVVFGLPYFLVQSRAAKAAFSLSIMQSPDVRRMTYLSLLTGTLDGAREIRLFGLGPYLTTRYEEIARRVQRESVRLAWSRGIGGSIAAFVAACAYFGAYLYLISQVAAGRLSVGSLTVYIGLFLQSQIQMLTIAGGVGSVLENGLFLRDLFSFLDRDLPHPTEPVERDRARKVSFINDAENVSGVTFAGVSFRYAGGDHDVLTDVSLVIPRGKVVAIVGENGAGKTTLIKLLCGLYQPTAGRVLLDGRDLATLDPAVLRAELGVLFQDFVHYSLTARENIGFGDISQVHSLAQVEEAACHAGAETIIAQLPHGYETQLGKIFDEGTELSGGEWQRIALARAYMRDAPILILDEPTASLDPKAEQQLFSEVRQMVAGRTAILISHRFSTVRLADEIIVLHEGRAVEQGDHRQLIQKNGRYAELYELQAAAYRE